MFPVVQSMLGGDGERRRDRAQEQGLDAKTRESFAPEPSSERLGGQGEPDAEAYGPDELLGALGKELAERDMRVELVVLGRSALVADRWLSTPTYDIDILALLVKGDLVSPNPLPKRIRAAEQQVMQRHGLPHHFLDVWVPEHMLAFGLPAGLSSRLRARPYGPALTVHVVSRFDQIHFKCLAMVENVADAEKHEADLRALDPSDEELLAAARWAGDLLFKRIQRSQMLLQEQLLGDGSRDPATLKLLDVKLAPASRRYRLGEWMIARPRWCGRIYVAAVKLVGAFRRRLRDRG